MQLIFSYYLNLNEILLFLTTFIKVQPPTALLNSEIKKAKKIPRWSKEGKNDHRGDRRYRT